MLIAKQSTTFFATRLIEKIKAYKLYFADMHLYFV